MANIFETISKIRYQDTSDFFLKAHSLNYAVIKGAALSRLAYGNPGKRESVDIDLLISRRSLHDIEKLLNQSHFHSMSTSRIDRVLMISSSHQTSPWIKNNRACGIITVDLNFDIFWGEYEGKRIDIDDFLSDTIEIDIYGVRVKTIPPLKAAIQLILHHYKDMNSIFLLATQKSIKYDMFKDLYYLLINNLNEIAIEKLYGISERYEIIPYVFYVLYYTGQVFNDVLIKKYIEAFRTPEGESLLNYYGLCSKERKEWKCNFKTRLEANDLYSLIKEDLTEKDIEKITINKQIFIGEST